MAYVTPAPGIGTIAPDPSWPAFVDFDLFDSGDVRLMLPDAGSGTDFPVGWSRWLKRVNPNSNALDFGVRWLCFVSMRWASGRWTSWCLARTARNRTALSMSPTLLRSTPRAWMNCSTLTPVRLVARSVCTCFQHGTGAPALQSLEALGFLPVAIIQATRSQ